jgi:hypothetical protein
MNLTLTESERDVLAQGLMMMMAQMMPDTAGRDAVMDLTRRVMLLEPEPEPEVMDFSVSGKIYCPCVGKYVATVAFAHKPDCAWVARYG